MLHLHKLRPSGFTLIELLVVISIIAILAAILFPVFAKARNKAHQTQCLSNIKQIGLAFQMYVNDYGEMLPNVYNWTYGWYTVTSPPLTKMWMADLVNKLNPYIRNDNLWYCPKDPWARPPGEDWDDGVVSYSYCIQWNSTPNGGGSFGEDPLCPKAGWGGSFIGMQPSQQCLMIDNGLTLDPSSNPDDYETPHAGGTGSNIVFWDGHAKLIPASQFGSIHPPLLLP